MSAVRREIFSFRNEQLEFEESVSNIIRKLIEQQRDTVMSPENNISYSHGEGWMAWQNEGEYETQGFQEHSHEEAVKFQDIIDHNISVLPAYIHGMVEGVHSDFMKSMYQTVHEATERTGNIVDAKQHASPAAAFLEMLQKVEFGVDKDGAVSRPQFHLGSEMHGKFMNDLEAQGADFKKKVEEITAVKETSALEREANRKARFVNLAKVQ